MGYRLDLCLRTSQANIAMARLRSSTPCALWKRCRRTPDANAVATIRDTLAAAFAESGDFINAIKEQELAIGLGGQNNDLSHYESGFAEKLALYLENKPYVAGR